MMTMSRAALREHFIRRRAVTQKRNAQTPVVRTFAK